MNSFVLLSAQVLSSLHIANYLLVEPFCVRSGNALNHVHLRKQHDARTQPNQATNNLLTR